MTANKLKIFPWHTILFSLYPILALAAVNIHEINVKVVLRPLLLSLAGAVLLLTILGLILKDGQIAGFVTSAYLILFYSYGHVYNLLHETNIAGILVGRNRILAVIWLVVAIFLTWLIIKIGKYEWKYLLSKSLNVVSGLLVVLQLGSLLFFAYRLRQVDVNEANFDLSYSFNSDPVLPNTKPPDIYYIILDAYGRSDVLQSIYGVDNSSFIEQLKGLGFYVAQCSTSNYAQTELSLSSSLNFNYIQTLGLSSAAPGNNAQLIAFIKNSAVRRVLEDLGYDTVAFATGYQWTEWENADHYLSPQGFWKLNEFENLVIRSSAGLLLLDSGLFNINEASIENIRGRTLFALDQLGSLPPGSSPKFVFAHLVIPHIPFVFGPDGESTLVGPLTSERPYTWDEYKRGYGNQVQYINSRIVDIVRNIIIGSEDPPIIIIQGDHGPGYSSNSDRMAILNAYYLPRGNSYLYANISPVNTFRAIFNEYFNGNFDLLDDVGYFSRYNTPFEFEVIDNNCLTN